MKKHFIPLLSLILVSMFAYFYGCSNETTPVSTGTTVSRIISNGSIVPTNHTQASGSMFVTDQDGNPISGLTSSNVTAQLKWGADMIKDSTIGTVTVTSNSSQGSNVAGAITMDYSGSMGTQQLDCMENGVLAYINAMKSGDLTEIIKFSTSVAVVQSFTSDKNLLRVADTSYWSGTGGTTALYQSIYQGTNDAKIQSSSFVRAVVAFTDGGENASSVTRPTMISNALTSGIPVYTVFLYSDTSNSYYRDMKNIADTTGGFNFWVKPDSCSNLAQIYNKISGQLVGSYSIVINWQGNLPPAGTTVNATITTTYNGMVSSFTKSFIML
ncbi:MAG: VWA domain-containing protein [Ignavibacteriae bacterium]|nr:VWA domain-containing protein [Ignavibacteriota bacterium]